ncbi:adult-specific rigid cuticular protein 15.7-like [Galendromus occidentalis]|uniref:Adult-specific rigid cuticular protein 15.7-like n=1 Tax=Galendromus occidentalis TaxID=34638 RepID=A0AAJ6QQ13_9ACAR|nr:adult-specific rigid cuticular protein 15.7-like [Galendromus occidentalis]
MKTLVFSSLVVSAVFVRCQASFGHSTSFRKQDDHGNYAFAYDIKNGHGAANGRKESGGPHGVVGSYYIGDIDGRHRTVHYVADKAGFRAQIKTNEPGTKTSYAAAAAYHSANGPTAPSGSHHGFHGLHGAAHFAAPIYAKPPPYGHGLVGHAHGPHLYGIGHYGGHYGAAPVAHFAAVDHFVGPHGGPFYG